MEGLRLAALALALAAGVGIADFAGPLAGSPWPWFSAAACLALDPPSRRRGATLLVCAALAGAGRAAWDADGAAPLRLPAAAAASDRAPERIVGRVVGPIEDRARSRRFLLALSGGTSVQVTARGARLPEVLPGDRVAVTGRLETPGGYRVPGAASAQRIARARGADLMLSADAGEVERLTAGLSLWRPAAWAQRQTARRIAERGGDPEGAGVVRALVAGDRGGLDAELAERFRRAGVAHVLAVSGLHLSAVALLVFAGVRRSWPRVPGAARVSPHRAAALAAAAAAIAYAMITGGRPSTLRALFVLLAVLLGLATDRRARVLDALGLAAILLLWRRPASLYDPSFQLSFAAAATLALVFSGRPRRRGLAGRALDLLRASVWASAATAPLAALTFGRVATGGIVSNLLVVPLVELVVLPLGLAGAALSAASGTAGGILLDVAIAAGGLACEFAAWFAARAPLLRVPPPSAVELAGCAALWCAAIALRRQALSPRRASLAALAGAALVAGSWIFTADVAHRLRPDLRVAFLDVGQGDATVIELPGGGTWLVDAGGQPFSQPGVSARERRRIQAWPGEAAVVRYLAHRRIRRLDRVILTHSDADHYAGLSAVARAVPVGELWIPRPHPERPRPPAYRALLIELALRGTRVVHPPLGPAAARAGVRLRVLGPRYLEARAAVDPVLRSNDNSLAVAVEYAGRRILLLGDLEEEGEELLARRSRRRLAADVVKVPHHGSRTSSTPALVRAARPRFAVISCGRENRFGFPAPEVVARWRRIGARVLRTDLHGTVTAAIAPTGRIEVETFGR